AFLVLAALASLTALRLPVLPHAGAEYAALELRRQALTALASRDASSVEARLAAWERLASRPTPYGLMAWVADLWPWLLGFGLACPVLGGLIGAQAPGEREKKKRDAEALTPTLSQGEREKKKAQGTEGAQHAARPDAVPDPGATSSA